MIKFTILLAMLLAGSALAQFQVDEDVLGHSFTSIQIVDDLKLQKHLISDSESEKYIEHFCKGVAPYFKKYGWETDPCGTVEWRVKFRTKNGHPLIYAVFGEDGPTTLVMSAVHPDEMTPIPMGFRFARYLQAHPEFYQNKRRIVVAPLVNPDGFIRNVPARTNANGIDLNRNFLTLDWYANSKAFWKRRKNRRFRHFPGYFPNSEVETYFQIDLIESFGPGKILSVHAPLGFLDYDAPTKIIDQRERYLAVEAKALVNEISKRARNYRVVNFSIYPGSLGNFAGHERNIMTITLELKTTNPKKVNEYWEQFLPGLRYCVEFDVEKTAIPGEKNASRFLTQFLNLNAR
jgi:murein peptide amidase A